VPLTVGFLSAELSRWDQLDRGAPEALVLPFFSDERPLHGAAGLCDWRLCGRLSRLVAPGADGRSRVAGSFGEFTLYPSGARLPFQRLVLFGLGAQESFDEDEAKEANRRILTAIDKMALDRFALVPPGRSTGRLSARRALELLLEVDRATHDRPAGANRELWVVESTAGQKEAADLAQAR
jgi:hypothetical protein